MKKRLIVCILFTIAILSINYSYSIAPYALAREIPPPTRTPVPTRPTLRVFQYVYPDSSAILFVVQGDTAYFTVWSKADVRGKRLMLRTPIFLELIYEGPGTISYDVRTMPTPIPFSDIPFLDTPFSDIPFSDTPFSDTPFLDTTILERR